MDTFNIKPRKHFLSIFTFLIFSLLLTTKPLSAADGEKIFKQNCAVCHSMGKNKITGPGLEGVMGRVPSEDWLKKWIKNNTALIKAGDAYATKIYAENGQAQMTVFNDLTDEDLAALTDYIKNPPAPKVAAVVPTGGGEDAAPAEQGVSPLAILIGVLAFLIILIGVLRGVAHSLKNLKREKEGLEEAEQVGFFKEVAIWLNDHRRTLAVIILFVVGGFLSDAWYGLKGIGIYEGYQPTQPIAFSHKLHAGDNAINCQYCHSTVEKSKNASIPSVNVCMNCHKGISKGPNTGEKEIAKIYEAAGWDAEKGEYNKPQKPIKWVKVHNLQDFVFFSHQQHVKVGKQECATCHGDLKEMTVAKQVQPLTMQWCIDCHRKTEVPGMKDNPYYESLHKKLAEKYKGQPITVDKMGGIECGKCHY